MQPNNSQVTVCLGDSITRGKVSVDYVRMLNHRTVGRTTTFVNGGVNGDLAINLLARLDAVITLQPAAVTVLIGTNDARAQLSDANARTLIRKKKLTTRPTIQAYTEHLDAIVERLLTETCATVALLSIPVLGQQLNSASVRCSIEFSAIIKQVARTHGVIYLPL
jgi:lysophospholipase L1-like esterase